MSMLGQAEKPPVLTLAGMDDNTTATAQEAVPLPYAAGQFASVARWISSIYNQRAAEAPQARPAKK